MRHIDNVSIQNAGNFLERQFTKTLPTLFEQKFAKRWMAGADSMFAPFTGNLGEATKEVEEVTMEAAGIALEYIDQTSDIPTVKTSIETKKYKVHCFALASEYTIKELAARQASNLPITTREMEAISRGLMQAVHNLGVFGEPGRNSFGLFNNPEVDLVTVGAYTPATATWQQHVDFFSETIADIEDQNEMTEGIEYVIIPNKLKSLLTRTRQLNDSALSPMGALLKDLGTENNGIFKGFITVNECRADLLERFGVYPSGTDLDRIIFVPANEQVASRQINSPRFLPVERRGMSLINIHYVTVSETMIHYPKAMRYVEIPTLS